MHAVAGTCVFKELRTSDAAVAQALRASPEGRLRGLAAHRAHAVQVGVSGRVRAQLPRLHLQLSLAHGVCAQLSRAGALQRRRALALRSAQRSTWPPVPVLTLRRLQTALTATVVCFAGGGEKVAC